MKLLKAQKALLDNTESEVIMYVGGYGSGKTTATALKSKQYSLSLLVDLNSLLFSKVTVPALIEATNFKGKVNNDFKKSGYKVLNFEDNSIFVTSYEDCNSIKLKYELIQLDNFDMLDAFQQEIVFFKMVALKPKQLILFVTPTDKHKDAFIRALSKRITTIHASIYDNGYLPKTYAEELIGKNYINKDYLEGIFK